LPSENATEAPRARSLWSGTITFGLVNIPVDLFTIVRARQTSMKMVDAEGRALGREYYCSKHEKVLEQDEIVRGREAANGKMVVVTDEELEAAAPEMSRDIELRQFVPLEQIPATYLQRPYLLLPSGRSARAYHLLVEAIERTGQVGVGMFVMRDHQYVVAIVSDGAVLHAQTLRFTDEIRSPGEVGLPKAKKAAAATVKRFTGAIDKLMRKALDLEELADRYAEAIRKHAERKLKAGKDVIDAPDTDDEPDEPRSAQVIDLMQILKQRLASSQGHTAKGRSSKPQRPHRAGTPHTKGKARARSSPGSARKSASASRKRRQRTAARKTS
jgi:DNA end-binding protein Ku